MLTKLRAWLNRPPKHRPEWHYTGRNRVHLEPRPNGFTYEAVEREQADLRQEGHTRWVRDNVYCLINPLGHGTEHGEHWEPGW